MEIELFVQLGLGAGNHLGNLYLAFQITPCTILFPQEKINRVFTTVIDQRKRKQKFFVGILETTLFKATGLWTSLTSKSCHTFSIPACAELLPQQAAAIIHLTMKVQSTRRHDLQDRLTAFCTGDSRPSVIYHARLQALDCSALKCRHLPLTLIPSHWKEEKKWKFGQVMQ